VISAANAEAADRTRLVVVANAVVVLRNDLSILMFVFFIIGFVSLFAMIEVTPKSLIRPCGKLVARKRKSGDTGSFACLKRVYQNLILLRINFRRRNDLLSWAGEFDPGPKN
jgi:hypothetical protein